jgi:O-antigen/teichoic acid export membrane protein
VESSIVPNLTPRPAVEARHRLSNRTGYPALARTLSYQVSFLALGRVVSFAALFFVPVVNVRTLSQADFGWYRQFWLLYDTVFVILALSFPASLLYYFPRAESEREKSIYLTQTLMYAFVMGLVSWIVYWVLTIVLHGELADTVRRYAWAFCFFTLFMMIARMMEKLFVAEKRAEAQAVYIAMLFSAQALTVIAFSWLTHRVDYIIWGLVGYALVYAVFALAYCGSKYRLSIRSVSARSFKEQLSYAVPLGLASIVLLVFAQTDKYVITHFLGREMFAVYSVGAMQLPFVDILRNSVMDVVFPLMAEFQKKEMTGEILDLWRRATLKMALAFFPIFVFLEVSARPFITILFTEEYAAATSVFMLYLLIFLRSSVDTTAVLMVFKKNAFMLKVNAVAFVAHVTLTILMFKRFGWLGVPATTVCMIYLQNGVFLWKSARLLKRSVFTVMPWGALFARFFTAAVLGALLFALYRVRPVHSFVELAVAGVMFMAVYAAVCLAFRFSTISDIKSMAGRSNG